MTIVFCGKVTHAHHAPTTIITVVVPEGIQADKPCLIFWQWAIIARTEVSPSLTNYNMEFIARFVEKVYPMVECRSPTDPNTWMSWNLRTNTMIMMDVASGSALGEPIKLEKVYPVRILGAEG